MLIDYGANVNDKDNDAVTPIFYAVSNGNQAMGSVFRTMELSQSYSKKKVQEALIDHFLHPLNEYSGERIVELLIQKGANINAISNSGNTPYNQAVNLGEIHLLD